MAKSGNKEACKILAKQLVQLRKQKNRTYAVSSKVTSMSTQTKVMNSQMKMAGAMSATAKVRTWTLSFSSTGLRSGFKILWSTIFNSLLEKLGVFLFCIWTSFSVCSYQYFSVVIKVLMWDLFMFKAESCGIAVNEVWVVIIGQEHCTVQSQT